MKKELILAIRNANEVLHETKERLINDGISSIIIPDEWLYDDLDESLSEFELIKYKYSKWCISQLKTEPFRNYF